MMKPRKFTTVPIIIFLLLQYTGCKPEQDSYTKSDYPYTPVAFTNVKIDGGFWLPRIRANRDVTLWYEFNKCEETGRIDNFAKLISKIAAAQEEDGYLYTARTINDPSYNYPGKEEQWSHPGHGHELYNAGHMYEAAVAYYQATGKRNFFDMAIKNADLICEVFSPGEGQMVAVPGHEEIEIGLIRMYRVTGDRKYSDMAKFFIDMRGRKDLRDIYGEYAQDHLPLLEQKTAVGHAVRGGYFYAGVADVASITRDQDYINAIDNIWNDVVTSKIYLTGNVGQHGAGEGYAGDYRLDNLKAYNETCAAIALAMWNHRMFLLKGESRYVDVLERTIYNGFLSGIEKNHG